MKPLQVRVADLMGLPSPIQSTSSVDMVPRANQADTTHILRFQGEVDQSKHDGELQQPEDLEDKGILYCELDTESSFPVKTEDGEGKENMVDPAIHCIKSSDGS